MPMNRDGQNRMDGFLHAAGNLDSANPAVPLYREHYRGGFSGSGASTSISSQQATGGVVLVAFWFAGYGVYKVQTGWYPTYTKFLANYVWLEKPLQSPLLGGAGAFATLYGLSTLALSL